MLPLALGAAGAAAALAWSLFESQWVELNEVEAPVEGLPPELEGFRVLHLSDFHLGTPSLNARALARAVEWAEGRRFDLAALTGDLLSLQRGERALREALERLRAEHGTYAVLGNHDVGVSRDPFSRATEAGVLAEAGVALLGDAARTCEARGRRVQVAGVEPGGYMRRRSAPERLADPEADLRILLCHFPHVVDRLPAGVYHLILAGHLHGGQICLPRPGGKIRLAHLRARYPEGLFRTPAGTLHVSRGLGTTFVPFRFFARPEATVLTLTRGY